MIYLLSNCYVYICTTYYKIMSTYVTHVIPIYASSIADVLTEKQIRCVKN